MKTCYFIWRILLAGSSKLIFTLSMAHWYNSSPLNPTEHPGLSFFNVFLVRFSLETSACSQPVRYFQKERPYDVPHFRNATQVSTCDRNCCTWRANSPLIRMRNIWQILCQWEAVRLWYSKAKIYSKPGAHGLQILQCLFLTVKHQKYHPIQKKHKSFKTIWDLAPSWKKKHLTMS